MSSLLNMIPTNVNLSEEEKEKIYKQRQLAFKTIDDNIQDKLKMQAVQNMYKQSLFETDDIYHGTLNQLLIDSKSIDDDATHYQIRQKMVNNIKQFITPNVFIKQNRKVLLYGKPGTGKSYMAEAIMNTLAVKKYASLFINTNALKDLIYQSFNNNYAKQHFQQISEFATRCDVLILDDLGTETSNTLQSFKEANDIIQQTLYNFASSRINKPIIITSNFTKDELAEMFNDKIISRLLPNQKQNKLPINFNMLTDLR